MPGNLLFNIGTETVVDGKAVYCNKIPKGTILPTGVKEAYPAPADGAQTITFKMMKDTGSADACEVIGTVNFELPETCKKGDLVDIVYTATLHDLLIINLAYGDAKKEEIFKLN